MMQITGKEVFLALRSLPLVDGVGLAFAMEKLKEEQNIAQNRYLLLFIASSEAQLIWLISA